MKFVAQVSDKKQLQRVAKDLRDLGCQIDQIMKLTGVITGDSKNKALSELMVKGLRFIEPDGIKRAGR